MNEQQSLFDKPSKPVGLYRRATGQGVPLDICGRRHKGNQESTEANKKVQPTKEQTRREVLAFIIGRGKQGATADEIAAAFECTHNHVAPRISELKLKGQVVPSGERRKTRSGCSAAVLVGREFAGC